MRAGLPGRRDNDSGGQENPAEYGSPAWIIASVFAAVWKGDADAEPVGVAAVSALHREGWQLVRTPPSLSRTVAYYTSTFLLGALIAACVVLSAR
jgi:hypothetical protein